MSLKVLASIFVKRNFYAFLTYRRIQGNTILWMALGASWSIFYFLALCLLAESLERSASVQQDSEKVDKAGVKSARSSIDGQGFALVVDTEVTSYLMMGALSPGLKRHSVSLFEGTSFFLAFNTSSQCSVSCPTFPFSSSQGWINPPRAG